MWPLWSWGNIEQRCLRPQVSNGRTCRRLHNIDQFAFKRDLAAAELHAHPSESDVQEMWDFWCNRFITVLNRHGSLEQCIARKTKHLPPWTGNFASWISKSADCIASGLLIEQTLPLMQHLDVFAPMLQTQTGGSKTSTSSISARRTAGTQVKCGQSWMLLPDERHNIVSRHVTLGRFPTHSVGWWQMRRAPVTWQCLRIHNSRNSLSAFSLVTASDVARLLGKINPTKATSSDGIPGLLLKCCSDFWLLHSPTYLTHLCRLVNYQLNLRVPIIITSLFKAGDPSVPSIHRPVSLLSILSKVLKKMVRMNLSPLLSILFCV